MSAAEQLVDRLEPTRERLVAAGHDARERAHDAAQALEPHLEAGTRTVGQVAGRVGRRSAAVAATLPGLLSRVLAILSSLLENVAEQGREVAARVEPPRTVKRRSRLRTASWVGGGMAVGFVAGWVAHARMAEPAAPPSYESSPGVGESPYDEERAAPIDARRTGSGV